MPDVPLPTPFVWLLVAGGLSLALFNIGRLVRAIRLDYLMGRIAAVVFEPLSDMLADRVQEQIDRSVQPIWHELRPNRATSLRDAVDRTEAGVDRLELAFDEHVRSVDAHAADPTAHLRPSGPDDGGAGPR